MRKLIFIMLIAASVWAQTVERSVLNYNTDDGMTWQERDAKFLADPQAWLDNHCKSADLEPILYHYTYTINDSAFAYLDGTQGRPSVLERYVNYKSGNIIECPVELTWATISKHSPSKVAMAKYNTWKGGPKECGVKAISAKHSALLSIAVVKLAKVDAICKDKTEWTEKASAKKLTEKEKRAAAWKIETGKAKESDYQIKASATGKGTK